MVLAEPSGIILSECRDMVGTEGMEDMGHMGNAEDMAGMVVDTEGTGDMEDTVDIEGMEATEDTEDMEDLVDTEDSVGTEGIEEDMGDTVIVFVMVVADMAEADGEDPLTVMESRILVAVGTDAEAITEEAVCTVKN